ncbi:hypothetical protein N3K66_005081 [Trichothecium roseum]|uniref:Uncharacterized protein n=1 Tax=Trichothecium roseum TaxID=47278 RepID=A0ACC0V2Y9_9HYPO|nr:hypothetical protein N3K66_005081 [Trichothecium roseum]
MSGIKDQGEKSLDKLLSTLTATLHPDTYVFTTHASEATAPPFSACRMLFREGPRAATAASKEKDEDKEGDEAGGGERVTAVVTRSYAEARGMAYLFPCEMITLDVESSLEAVGFMAAVAARLAGECGVGVNPVSGFWHDHLFVPEGKGGEALGVLERLAAERRGGA